jgi:hypothetical protein
MTNEKSREMIWADCPKCDRETWILHIVLAEPEIVNPGTPYEWVRTERFSKCVECYM